MVDVSVNDTMSEHALICLYHPPSRYIYYHRAGNLSDLSASDWELGEETRRIRRVAICHPAPVTLSRHSSRAQAVLTAPGMHG